MDKAWLIKVMATDILQADLCQVNCEGSISCSQSHAQDADRRSQASEHFDRYQVGLTDCLCFRVSPRFEVFRDSTGNTPKFVPRALRNAPNGLVKEPHAYKNRMSIT